MVSAKKIEEEKPKEEKPIQRSKYKVIKKTPLKWLWEKPTRYYYAMQLGFSEFLAMNVHLYGDGSFFYPKDE